MKNSSPKGSRTLRTPPGRIRKQDRSEWELFLSYREKLRELTRVHPELTVKIAELDIDNDFYWLFRLSDLLANARKTFGWANAKYFSGALPEPKIIFCDRTSGGYYNKTRHTIGISLPMTIEFGEPEFRETLLHEIAHIVIQSHSTKFHKLLRQIGGTGRKAPVTMLLGAKRKRLLETRYPITVECPNCKRQQRYRTRHALHYACKSCCNKYSAGKFDIAFMFVEVLQEATEG